MKNTTQPSGVGLGRNGKPVNLYLNVELVELTKQLAKSQGDSLSDHFNKLMKKAIRRETDRMRKKAAV